MHNTLLLIKISLREMLDARKFKENKKRTMSFGVFVGLMGLLFVALSTLYSFIYANMFASIGYDLIYTLYLMGGVASLLVLSTCITRAKGIFISKDYDMLRAMPLKKGEIVSAKVVSMFLVELLYAAIILIPCGVVCSIIAKTPIYAILSLPITLLLPGVPVVAGSLVGLFVALIADRSKAGNIITILLYGVFFLAVFYFSTSMGGAMGGAFGSLAVEGEEVDAVSLSAVNSLLLIGKLNPVSWFFLMGKLENPLWYLAYLGVNLVSILLAVFLIAALFDKVYAVVTSAKGNTVYRAKELKQKGIFSTLFKNEAKRFFSSRLYCINSLVGGLAAIVMSVVFIFSFRPIFEEKGEEFALILSNYAYLGTLLVVFFIGISTPAGISISMEGSTFWITKTMPVPMKEVVKAKIWFSMAVISPFTLVSSVLLIVITKATLLSAISLILSPLCFLLGASSLGLLLNTSFYKLKWKNEAEVVKNSSGVIMSMLADIGITLVLGGVGVVGVLIPVPYLGAVLFTFANAAFGTLFYFIARTVAGDKMKKIEDF